MPGPAGPGNWPRPNVRGTDRLGTGPGHLTACTAWCMLVTPTTKGTAVENDTIVPMAEPRLHTITIEAKCENCGCAIQATYFGARRMGNWWHTATAADACGK